MSVINKMLKDLEARERAAQGAAPAKAPHDGLRSVADAPPRSGNLRSVLLWVLCVVALGCGGYYLFLRMQTDAPLPSAALPVPKVANADVPTSVPLVNTTAAVDAKPQPSGTKLDSRVGGNDDVAAVQGPPSVPPVAKAVTTRETPAASATDTKSAAPAVSANDARSTPAPLVQAEVSKPPLKAVSTAAAKPEPKPLRAATPAKKPAPVTSSNSEPDSADKVVMEKRDHPLTAQDEADARYRHAAQLVSQGQTEPARAELATALAREPAHRAARELAAMLALQSGRPREAETLLLTGLKLAPDHLPFAQLLARVQVEQGADAQAIATLESARSAAAGNADYFSFLAWLYHRVGRDPDAVQAYRETTALRPQDARAWLGLGISLEATQNLDAAATAYLKALQAGNLEAKLAQYAQQRLTVLKK